MCKEAHAALAAHAVSAHLSPVARWVQPALEHAMRKGAGVLAAAAAILQDRQAAGEAPQQQQHSQHDDVRQSCHSK
jgi:hypothetical protein